MKNSIPKKYIFWAALFSILAFHFIAPMGNTQPASIPETECFPIKPKKPKSTSAMPADAMEQFLEMTANPKLKKRTPENLLKVRNRLKSGYYKFAKKADNTTWEERGPVNVAGRTRAILIDANDPTRNTIWAGSVSGGLWKTTNFQSETVTWSPVNDFFQNIAVACLIQDPSDFNVMYFGTGEGWFNLDAVRGLGIWKTEDGGDSWNQLPATNKMDFNYVQKIVVDTQGTIYACTRDEGVQKSIDGGNTWTKILGGAVGGAFSNRAADIEIASNGDLFASLGIFSSDGIYKSTNGGNTWTDLINSAPANGLPAEGFERIELATAPSNESVVYALFQGAQSAECMGIYRTDDGGLTWSSLPVPATITESSFARNQAWYNLIAKVDPLNESVVYIGGIDLLRSVDGGANWTAISHWYGGGNLPDVHADQHSIEFYPGESLRAVIGNDGGIYSINTNLDKPVNPPYCIPDHVEFFSDFINRVDLNTLSNQTGRSIAEDVEGYSDYTNISTILAAGNSYTINITTNNSFDDSKVAAWIDWNGNNVFDPEEQILNASGVQPYEASFTVPPDAAHITTRMRVRMQFGPDYVPDPCASSGFNSGETEDYTIVIQNCLEGISCNDGDNCTINDTLDSLCQCSGIFYDLDEDNQCDYWPAPDFTTKNNHYNVTQFYSCAIHPEEGSNTILGGTQDNGTQLFSMAGLNSTTEVTGGDGGFCFIDQDQPNIQISTYVYNNIRITTDSWETFESHSIGDNSGYFINPMDYDSETNILYSAFDAGYLARIRNVGGQTDIDNLQLDGLESLKISAVKVDPNVQNRIWVATPKDTARGNANSTARILAIDDAYLDVPTVKKVIEISDEQFEGFAYTRAIEVCTNDPNRMIILFANYGIPNLWITDDGGETWGNIDGNLPDIPVLWVLFNPLSKAGAIVATEMGIWSTNKLDGDQTHWEAMNEGLANVRVDMLKYRPSDQILVAATHGRGIFTTTLISNCPNLEFSADIIPATCEEEANGSIILGDPSLTYSWSTGEEGRRIDNLSSGIYHVTISTSDSCHYVQSYTVESESNMIVSELIINNISCSDQEDGSISTMVSGGIGEVMYQWSNGANEAMVSNLSQGEYSVTVTDENDCTLITSAIVSLSDPLLVAVEQVSANEAIATPSGGTPPYSYQWSDGSGQTAQLAVNLELGNYSVTVTDAEGCSYKGDIEIALFESEESDLWDIIGSAGQSFKSDHVQVDWTIGEILIDHRINNTVIVSEGFHQLFNDEIPLIELLDLEVVRLVPKKEVFFPGESLFDGCTVIVRNNGTVAVPGDYAVVYLSEDELYNFADPYIGFVFYDTLQPGQSDTIEVFMNFDADIPTGDYNLLLCLDEFEFIEEVNEGNNCAFAPIRVSDEGDRPDLIITDIDFKYDEYFPGDRALPLVHLLNIGNSPAFISFATHSAYVSSSMIPSEEDKVRSFFTFEDFHPDQPVVEDVLITFDERLAPGTYYVIGEVDSNNRVIEENEENNFYAVEINIRDTSLAPDLIVSSATITNTPVVGGLLESTTVLANIGEYRIIESIMGVYLTKEDTLGTDQIRIGSIEVAPIEVGQSIQVQTAFAIPDNLDVGLWNVIYAGDAFFRRFESNEENNSFLISDVTLGSEMGASFSNHADEMITLFPNPTTGNLFIRRSNDYHYHFEIVMPNGQRLGKGILRDDQELQTKALPPGLYWLILEDKYGKRELLPFVKM